MSRRLGARAFTYGSDVYFGHGMYDPGGSSGGRLLAHELAHVVQQGRADRRSSPQTGQPAPFGHGSADVATRTAAPMIQRTATWDKKGAVHPVNNLAAMVLGGQPAGQTLPVLNGESVRDHHDEDARAALHPPKLAFATVPAAKKGAANEFDATVDTVPTNTGSFDESVLKMGPSTTVAPKVTIGALLGLPECAGNGDFDVYRHRQAG